MIVEVRPGPMTNKGGELMLHAVADRLSGRHDLVVDHWIGPYAARARLGLLQKLWWKRLGPLAGLPGLIVPRSVRQAYGLVTEREIESVLDASGFAYGDQFGPERTERAAANAHRWRGRGLHFILLPQAFGPFSSTRIRRAAHSLLSQADLVYARDAISLRAVQGLGTDADIRLAPDITVGLNANPPADVQAEGAPHGYLIPNEKMLTHADAEVAASYPAFLEMMVRELRARGVQPILLIHETAGGDRRLATAVSDRVAGGVPIIEELDPLRLKGLIATAVIVAGSRFHALLAALSQGVPVIAAGWSHKYRSLLDAYGSADALLEPPASPEAVRACLDRALGPTRDTAVAALRTCAAQQRAQVEIMWDEVLTALASP